MATELSERDSVMRIVFLQASRDSPSSNDSPRPRKVLAIASEPRVDTGTSSKILQGFALQQATDSGGKERLCLAALHVLLQDENGGHLSWLESTKALSCVSLQLCLECRTVTSFHVRVGNDTPRTIWADVPRQRSKNSPPKIPTLSSSSRVPAIKPVKVTWERCAEDISRAKGLSNVTKVLVFADSFGQSVEGLTWPRSLQQLRLGSGFNQPIGRVSWPSGVKRITFGESFNQSLDDAMWPNKLECLVLGHGFNHPLVGVLWPLGLMELKLGNKFNQPVDKVIWPPTLEKLTFGRRFNQPINKVRWPSMLKELGFGWFFDYPLHEVAWPPTLEQLVLLGVFNKPLDEVRLPVGLKRLTLGGHFNNPLETSSLPDALEELTLGWSFNQSLTAVQWPCSLIKLTIGYQFNQAANCIKLPSALQVLEFCVFSRQSLGGIEWPASLRVLTVSRSFDLTGTVLPKGVRVCRGGYDGCKVQSRKRWSDTCQSCSITP